MNEYDISDVVVELKKEGLSINDVSHDTWIDFLKGNSILNINNVKGIQIIKSPTGYDLKITTLNKEKTNNINSENENNYNITNR